MDEKKSRCLQIVSQHVPIYFQQFHSYSNRKCKKSPFSRTAAHIFVKLLWPLVSAGDAPATITQYVAWMERQLNACQTPRSMYLSVFNSFRVILCLNQCVSPKSLFLPHFCFPWGRPSPGNAPGAITLNVVRMERQFNACKLSRCMCPSNYYRFWDTVRYWWRKRHFIIPPCIRRPI